MFNLKNITALTNTRPTKDEGMQLAATPTPGLMRLTSKAGNALKVSDCHRIAVINLPTEEGEQVPAIYISPFRHEKDASGDFVKDEDGKNAVFVEEGRSENSRFNLKGQKLSFANGQSGALQFSSASVYQALEGDTNGTSSWDIPGLDGEEDWILDAGDGTIIYPLRKANPFFEEKTARAEKS